MKLSPILFFVTVFTATGQLLAQNTVLTDDFNDGVVDAEKWDIILPFGGSAISEANGVLTTAERGTLFTKEEMPANLEVTGRFQMNHASEHFKVVLRSDGSIVDGSTFAERKGISFAFSNDGDQISIQRQGPDEIEILAVKSYPLTTGQSYSFRIVADGDALILLVNGTEELTTSNSYAPGNLVGIYSRELAGRSSDVDSLSIKNLAYEGGTFQIIEGDFTWQEAKADAESRGGRLAVLNTQDKIDEVNSYLNGLGTWPYLYIGLTDEEVEGEWKWITGQPLTVSNWYPGEPSNNPDASYGEYFASSRNLGTAWNNNLNSWPDAPSSYLLEFLQNTLLNDDFNDGVVDAEKWDITLPFGGSAISEANGVLTTAERGTLFTKEEMPANLEVTGSFRMNHAFEEFKVVLRSDASIVDSNTVAERKGISFAFSNDGDQISIQRQGPDEIEILAVKSYSLTTGQSYSFRIVARGDSLSLSVNGTEELTTSSSYSAGNLVGIYSRELAGCSSDVARLSIGSLLANADTDGDGLDDSVETNTGSYVSESNIGTDPNNPDSDGDGVPDGLEISEATDPNNGDEFNPFSVNVIAYFPFNGNAIDESGSSFDLAAKNGASLTTGKDGDSSGAYAFDGQDDYLEASGNFGDTTSLTISLWVNPASLNTGSRQTIFNDATRANGNDVRISLHQGNSLSGRSDKGSDFDLNRSFTSSAASPGKWTHVVYTASEDGPSSIYFNGVYSGGSETGGRNVGYHSPLRLGTSEYNTPFHGKIDSVRYYERALPANEVLQLYQSEKNPDYEGGTLQIIEGDFTWQEAKADAEARGGRLAVLNTQEKIDEVNSYLNGLGTWPALYIGLTDEEVEGEWKWINGEPLSFSNWGSGEPTNGTNESYGEYFSSSRNLGTRWNDTLNLDGVPSSYLLELPLTDTQLIRVAAGSLPESSWDGVQSVKEFHIGKTEVTWAQFQEGRTWAVANGYDIGSVGKGINPNHPVTNVNWYAALKWCNASSEKEGLDPVYKTGGAVYRVGEAVPTVDATANGYRLPSEKEWEFAARGGVDTNGYQYSGSDDIDAVAWYNDNSGGSPQVVATKQANELGIHDMSGNVWEWCFDASSESRRVDRGAAWRSGPDQNRVAFRRNNPIMPTASNGMVGFRVAHSALYDTDGDGEPDASDAFPLDTTESVDTDGDGTGDNADTDDDGDGMPDEWENRYSLLKNEDDRTSDHDGDGVPAWMEYIAGTSPNDETSRLDVIITMVDGKPHVSLDTVSGRSYEFLVTQDFQTYVVWHTQSGTGNSEELVFDMDSPEVEAEFGANPGKTFFFQVRIQLSD